MQSTLRPDQIAKFYHDAFVSEQVRHFQALFSSSLNIGDRVVVDVGGGVGYFALAVGGLYGVSVRVVDMDPLSVAKCQESGVHAVRGDATSCVPMGDEAIVCFNLILHHLVGSSEKTTRGLQGRAIRQWRGDDRRIFINEYIYESYVKNVSGWLIYQITSNRLLSALCEWVSRVIPAFRANTFGVGVRFRSHKEWRKIFEEEGFSIVSTQFGNEERVALPLRLLLIKSIRKDSYLLM